MNTVILIEYGWEVIIGKMREWIRWYSLRMREEQEYNMMDIFFAVKIHGISTAPLLLVDFGLDPSFIFFFSDNSTPNLFLAFYISFFYPLNAIASFSTEYSSFTILWLGV